MVGGAELGSNVEVVQEIYSLLSRGQVEAATALVAPDAVAYEADSLPYSGRYEGRQGFARLIANLQASWSDLECSEFEYLLSGDYVAVLFQLRATSRSTGIKVDQRLCELWKLRNGEVVYIQPFYFDTHEVWAAFSQEGST